ncbi:MAG: purine-binding chemotaxis protein CheW [Chromatiaceae bacterium]|nr:purine-binding chemotaxis protein CheW [Gammaproteobacteria bacterium]MCB1861899.1 purine-binding chemotaxis protein CheW [Gammaproteobacteria bacterium]MCB1871914.1 purine-binding chemotaxis protein CheW [Gammaproteobacteria bacterium]MCP5426812.1 purine-binding chemotaxis protein CheW [Chromatiaceae bacterium]MCP5446609.1 purine-binding chemotaxis protein CheW [Chromatiaceae bacterium]
MQKEPRQAVAESVTDRCRNEFLTFSLGGEDYGVDILRVQEIRGWEAVTRIPNSPLYVKGVLNLRGTIVPVFDLRLRIGMPGREYTKGTVVVVLRIVGSDGEKNIGIVVDGVSDVLNMDAAEIQRVPDFGSRLNTEFIVGMVSAGKKMVMLLDVDRLAPDTIHVQKQRVGAA